MLLRDENRWVTCSDKLLLVSETKQMHIQHYYSYSCSLDLSECTHLFEKTLCAIWAAQKEIQGSSETAFYLLCNCKNVIDSYPKPVFNRNMWQIWRNAIVGYSPTHSTRRRKVRWVITVADLTTTFYFSDWTSLKVVFLNLYMFSYWPTSHQYPPKVLSIQTHWPQKLNLYAYIWLLIK